jgi:molecular chaperone GrpE
VAAKRKSNAQDVWSPLAIQVDDELLAEAVASVERRGKESPKHAKVSRAVPPQSMTPSGRDQSEIQALELGVDEIALLEVTEARVPKRQVATVHVPADGRDALIEELTALVQTLERQRAGLDLLNEKLLARVQAIETEMEQMHRRSLKERDQALKSGQEITIREFLPAMDNLDRARAYVAADPTQVMQGFVMVAEQFRRALTRLGAERIDASVGTTFDPDRHEAILQVHRGDLPQGSVVEEARSGWTLNGRLLRAAQVAVVAGPRAPSPAADPLAAAPEALNGAPAAPSVNGAAQASRPASGEEKAPGEAQSS